jgi:hypothetical protein
VVYDWASEYDPTSGLFSPKQSGLYLVDCEVGFNSTAGAVFGLGIVRNGAELAANDMQSGTNNNINVPLHAVVQLSPGDDLYCSPYQTTGSTQTIQVQFAHRVYFAATRLY